MLLMSNCLGVPDSAFRDLQVPITVRLTEKLLQDQMAWEDLLCKSVSFQDMPPLNMLQQARHDLSDVPQI